MNLQEKLSVIDSIPKMNGIFGFSAITEKKVLKKSRITKEPTPKRLQQITCEFRGSVWMGSNYQEMVNKKREKEGSNPDFESSGTYCKPISENLLLWEHEKTGQLYFRVYFGYGATTSTETKFFDAFGKEISPEEMEEIKPHYLPLESKADNQGLSDPVIVRNYKVENVTKLKRYETWLEVPKCATGNGAL